MTTGAVRMKSAAESELFLVRDDLCATRAWKMRTYW